MTNDDIYGSMNSGNKLLEVNMYWVHELRASGSIARKSFQAETAAVKYADEQRESWRCNGVDRHYEVYYLDNKVYSN